MANAKGAGHGWVCVCFCSQIDWFGAVLFNRERLISTHSPWGGVGKAGTHTPIHAFVHVRTHLVLNEHFQTCVHTQFQTCLRLVSNLIVCGHVHVYMYTHTQMSW